MTRLPTYFISHGGGPWPWLPDWRADFHKLEDSLNEMVASWPEPPRAILMVSAHWETDVVKIQASANPPMVYDYYGFPDFTYSIKYPAPGAPEFAQKTLELLTTAGIAAELDSEYGFDHGAFAPMQIMYPDANVPMFQVSILKSYDPQKHIDIGRALASLRDEGVMIIGSGLSYHNLRAFNASAKIPSEAFDAWLADAMAAEPELRREHMRNWEQAPHARASHPQEDHLVPLFVTIGAAGDDAATRVYHDVGLRGGVSASSYRFG